MKTRLEIGGEEIELPPCPDATRLEIARDVLEFLWSLLRDYGAGRPAWRRAVSFALIPAWVVGIPAAFVASVAIVAAGALVGFFLVLPVLSLWALWIQSAVSTPECKRIRWDADQALIAARRLRCEADPQTRALGELP